MADENDKTMIEGASGENNQQDSSPKKGMNKLVLFGGIGLGAVIIGIVLALFVIKPMMSGSDSAEATEEKVETTHAEKKETPKKEHKEKSESGSSLIYAMNNIVVNPAGTGGSRFLSVSFGFELESGVLEEEFAQKEAIIRDALITILSSKTVAQLTDPKEKEIVRYQIKKRVSQLMNTDQLAGVYYTDFVLQ